MNVPHSIESEMSLLGAILLGGVKTFRKVEPIVSSGSMFYREANGRIFTAMNNVVKLDLDLDIVSLRDELQRQTLLDQVGGLAYIMQLGEFVPSTSHAITYAQSVRYYSDRRKLIELALDVINKAEKDDEDPPAIADNFLLQSRSLSGLGGTDATSHVDDSVASALDEIDARLPGHKMAGISSEWKDLDDIVGGWRKGELIIIGARPSMGKSAFALNIGLRASLKTHKVLFISIEMSEAMTTHRLLAMQSGIDLKRIQNAVMTIEERHRLRGVRAQLFDSGFYMASSNPMSFQAIRSKAVAMASTQGCDMVIVDYLQMISSSGQNRTQEVGQISRSLKSLARELDVPVIALSSLNRSSEKRDDKRPMMSDIRESGDIESDADVVMFLYRPSYYMASSDRSEIERDECEIIIGKNRNGPIGTAILEYIPSIGRFNDYIPGLL